MNAQAKSKNAWLASQQAAMLAFKSSLLADQALFDAQRIRTCMLTHTQTNNTCFFHRASSLLELAESQSVAATSLSIQLAGSQSVAATSLSIQLAGSQCAWPSPQPIKCFGQDLERASCEASGGTCQTGGDDTRLRKNRVSQVHTEDALRIKCLNMIWKMHVPRKSLC